MFAPQFDPLRGLLALLIATGLIFGHPSTARAADCSEAAGQARQVKYSSKVSELSVTICADWMQLTSKKSKLLARKPALGQVLHRKLTANQKANRFVSRPMRPKIVEVTELRVVQFSPVAYRHSKYGYLFGRRVQLTFTPKTYLWHFSDQSASTSKHPSLTLEGGEKVTAKLRVGYRVTFRQVAQSQVHQLSGLVYRTAWPVSASATAHQRARLRYVALDCVTYPIGPGCP